MWRTNGGQKQKKKSSNYSHLSELLLFLCCLTRINPLQYSAIFCNKVTNIYLNGKGFAIAECSKIFISGGQMADTE